MRPPAAPSAPRPEPRPAPGADAPLGLRDRFAALRHIGPFLRMVWAASPGLALASVGLRLLRAVLPVTSLWIGKLIIDEVVRLAALPDAPGSVGEWWAAGTAGHLGLLLLAEFGLAILSDLAGRVAGLADSLLSERLTLSLSLRLMDHAATLDLAQFEDAAFQDRLERARRQAAGRMTLLGQILGQLQDSVTVATFAGGLFAYNPWLILLLGLALVPSFLGEAHFNARAYRLDYARTPERREIDYLRQTAASAETAKEVKIFALEGFLRDRYLALSESYYAARRRIARARAAWGALFAAMGTLGYYAAYVWIIAATLSGRLTLGDLTFLAGAFLRLRGLIEGLLVSFSSTAAQALYLEDLLGFFETRPDLVSREGALPVPRPIREGFRFEDVGFRYPGQERWAVRHLDLTLAAGETVALVGENGAGKTTLVKLLARLYDPVEGRIMLDGVDLRDYDLDDLRARVGVIFQDFVRYGLPARDNVAVGRIAARGDQARIEAAARRGLADAVVDKLPRGWDQMIGKRFEGGVDLSGGEWQKLALARAYMREAEVLILDEPTAALDARAEFEVFARFRELSAGRTTVLISHRFSSVRMADRILVLEGGRVEASGTHAELVAAGGRYAELFELQAAGYR